MKFQYIYTGGTGQTSIELNLLDNSIFTMKYHEQWINDIRNIDIQIFGKYKKSGNNYDLVVDKLFDREKNIMMKINCHLIFHVTNLKQHENIKDKSGILHYTNCFLICTQATILVNDKDKYRSFYDLTSYHNDNFNNARNKMNNLIGAVKAHRLYMDK